MDRPCAFCLRREGVERLDEEIASCRRCRALVIRLLEPVAKGTALARQVLQKLIVLDVFRPPSSLLGEARAAFDLLDKIHARGERARVTTLKAAAPAPTTAANK